MELVWGEVMSKIACASEGCENLTGGYYCQFCNQKRFAQKARYFAKQQYRGCTDCGKRIKIQFSRCYTCAMSNAAIYGNRVNPKENGPRPLKKYY